MSRKSESQERSEVEAQQQERPREENEPIQPSAVDVPARATKVVAPELQKARQRAGSDSPPSTEEVVANEAAPPRRPGTAPKGTKAVIEGELHEREARQRPLQERSREDKRETGLGGGRRSPKPRNS